jgi:xanthine dehydrogenase YagT iron-sulfur-binding subunit
MLAEAAEGWPSAVTGDGGFCPEEIRERMSGNLCRCAAYPNIVAVIMDVAEDGKAAL